jgi:hypothetical protein
LLANAMGGLHLSKLTIRYCSAAYRSIIRALCMLMRPITLRALQFLLAECIPSVGAGLLANAVGGLHLSRLTLQRSMASLQLDRSHASRPLGGGDGSDHFHRTPYELDRSGGLAGRGAVGVFEGEFEELVGLQRWQFVQRHGEGMPGFDHAQ